MWKAVPSGEKAQTLGSSSVRTVTKRCVSEEMGSGRRRQK